MTGARGDALDWALALARAPGERLVLRQRPLPGGIDSLLQIAAGHVSEELAAAVARTGETEARLIEAVRFYLREVLFHSGADAYRILGLERGASHDRIKAHHRWLQQWLHPDRHSSDWDAIFAGRVNAAWNQLRTEERRRAYDTEHPAAPVPKHGPVPPVLAAWVRDDLVVERSPRQRWERRAPVLALGVACVGLGLLALRDLARDDALAAATGDRAQREEAGPRLAGPETDPFSALRLPASNPVPGNSAGHKSDDQAVPVQAMAPRKPSVVLPQRTASRSEASADVRALVREPAKPIPAAAVAGPVPRRVAITPPISAAPPGVQPTDIPVVQATPPLASGIAPAARPQAAPVRLPVDPPQAKALAAPEPKAPSTVPSVQAARVRQAQQVGARLLDFMQGPGANIPPIWDTLSAQQGASQLRGEMLAAGKATVSQPDWRVGEREAQMQVSLRYADGSSGRMNAGLVWREQRWLVKRLSMERDR